MKKLIFFLSIFLFFMVSVLGIYAQNRTTDTIVSGTGQVLGTVTATTSVTEHRKTGETTGDTKMYGFVVTGRGRSDRQVRRLAANSLTNATNIAYANALYDVIQQIKKMGGNALNELAAANNRSFDLNTNTETVTVTITAQAVKTK